MKFRSIGHAAWAGAVSLGVMLGVTSCSTQDNTIDYVFVSNSKNNPGQINVYLVDNKSGVLTEASGSPYTTGKNPVSLATSPNQEFLYVLNHDDNTIVSYSISSDASLKKVNSYTTPGTNPTSVKINAAGTYLYVTDAFQAGFNAANPGPGALVAYPINADGSLGNAVSYPTCNNPVDLTVLANGGEVYVVDDPAPNGQPPKLANSSSGGVAGVAYTASGACTADSGQITAFAVGTSGALTTVPGSPFNAGTTPVAIASDPTNRFVYVTDLTANQLLGYGTSANGALTALNNGPFATGFYPDAVTVDPRGLYIYVANYNASGGTISAYAIAQSTGIPSTISGTGSYGVTTGPAFVLVEPNGGKYLYSADFVDNTVYGLSLNPNTGVLGGLPNDPYPAAGQPTAIAAITHGPHPTEVLPQY
jgi:6-phosphogluconolactonase